MKCPHAPNLDVSDKCMHTSCWGNDPARKNGCVFADLGRTEVTVHDIAHLWRLGFDSASKQVETGKDLLQQWLSLVAAAEALVVEHDACDSCGEISCTGGAKCSERAAKIARLSRRIPLGETLLLLRPAHWNALLKSHYTEIKALFYALAFENQRSK